MASSNPIQFDNTAVAFRYKSDYELKKANFIFSVINNPTFSSVLTKTVKMAMALHLPVKPIIRKTVFGHFCGGENIAQSEQTIQKLAAFDVKTILDFSAEGAKTEEGFDRTAKEVLLTFDKAKNNPKVPFCVFKTTGMGDVKLMEKVHQLKSLTTDEQAAWDRVLRRVDEICAKGYATGVPVLIDAEDSWYQDAIDSMAYAMMAKYNKERAIVFNTYQMYRVDMLDNLRQAIETATQNNYFIGIKMVRGAYMEIERERAGRLGYPDPIHATKEGTDQMFNDGLQLCVEHRDRVSLMCGSHNEYSNQYLADLLNQHGLDHNDRRFWFAQLLGMSDNISFNLAQSGYNVVKYVPYGPVNLVMPYLLRRAAENTSVAGQSSRELTYIRKELNRRKSTR